jgi:TrmH family RNA methyltransferase
MEQHVMMEKHLTSIQNPLVKQVIHLRDRHERDKTGLFLIEGYREILRATDAGWKFDQLLVCSDLFLGSNEPALIQRIASRGTQVITTSEKVFQKISYRDRPDGLLAIAPQKVLNLNDLRNQERGPKLPFYVVAEAIEKPGNLGTILRSSDAVGVSGLIVCDRCTDIYNPNVVRASVGTLFTVPTVEAEGEETLQWLKEQGIAILAATPSATHEFTQVDLVRPLAIAVGTEQLGLSERWMQQSDLQVRIPMNGVADSLNVAMATTLLLYEVLRQRQHAQSR